MSDIMDFAPCGDCGQPRSNRNAHSAHHEFIPDPEFLAAVEKMKQVFKGEAAADLDGAWERIKFCPWCGKLLDLNLLEK